MKTVLLGITVLSFLGFSDVFSESTKQERLKLVSVDSIELMRASEEGKKLAENIKKQIEDYQVSIKDFQEKISSLEKEITEKKEVWSKKILAEKEAALETKKAQTANIVRQKQLVLNAEFQKRQEDLREKQMKAIKELAEKEGWEMVVEKQNVLFAKDNTDQTDRALKKIDFDYEKLVKNKENTNMSKTKKAVAA